MYPIDPTVLDEARRVKGLTSDESLGHELGVTGATIRNYRSGRTEPPVHILMQLVLITGRPMENMLLRPIANAA